MQRLANTGSLTDLPIHSHAREILTREVRLAARNARPLGVLMVDIDNFKLFNDSYGHLKGYEVIKLVAGVFAANVRDTDWVTRYAGDEFLVILPESDAAGTAAVARRVIARLAAQSVRDRAGLRIPITCSIGSATLPVDGQTESDLIDLADRAMYEIKRAGGNGHQAISEADAYSAMTSDRPYRKGLAQAAAIAERRRVAGIRLDPAVVETFLQTLIGVAVTADDVADPSRS